MLYKHSCIVVYMYIVHVHVLSIHVHVLCCGLLLVCSLGIVVGVFITPTIFHIVFLSDIGKHSVADTDVQVSVKYSNITNTLLTVLSLHI